MPRQKEKQNLYIVHYGEVIICYIISIVKLQSKAVRVIMMSLYGPKNSTTLSFTLFKRSQVFCHM